MEERTIIRPEDLDGVQEGEIVVVGLENTLSSAPQVEIFLSQLNRERCPFGGVLTLAKGNREGRTIIRETSYKFNVRGVVSSEKDLTLYEEGTPRFDYYDSFLRQIPHAKDLGFL